MSEPNDKLKRIINKGAEISGGVVGATLSLIIAGPIGAIGGAVVGPIISDVFQKVGYDISERILGNREQIRVGATYSLAVNKLEQNIQHGAQLRKDDFYSLEKENRSKAEIILEGTLLKARSEYEEKKIKYYSNFLANINLDESISFEEGNTLLRIFESLSYRQIAILSYIYDIEKLNTNKWMISFSRIKELDKYQDFHSEIMDLYYRQILQQPGTGLGMSPSILIVSSFGKRLCRLLEISEVEKQDIQTIEITEQTINEIITKVNNI
jgi:hypothetical protein